MAEKKAADDAAEAKRLADAASMPPPAVPKKAPPPRPRAGVGSPAYAGASASSASSSTEPINICNDSAVDAQLNNMLASIDSRSSEIVGAGKTVSDVKIAATGALVVQEVKDLRLEVHRQKAALTESKEVEAKLMRTTNTIAAAVTASEAHRPLLTVMKCRGVETAAVYEWSWPAISRACRDEARVNEYTCLNGIGRVYCKGDAELREMQVTLTSVLERAGAAEVSYILRGKPTMERSKEEQMAVAFRTISKTWAAGPASNERKSG